MTKQVQDNRTVIAGAAAAPGEVVCGVHYGPARSGLAISLMEPRKSAPAHLDHLLLSERARGLTGVARYLSPDWDIPSCPVIGKGPNDHCKHGFGNLDYCPHCEHEDDDLSFADMEI